MNYEEKEDNCIVIFKKIVNNIKYDNKCNGYFNEKRIEDIKFEKCIFRNVRFEGTIFNNVIFNECKFINTIFDSAYSIRNNFLEFYSSEMYNVNFERCNFNALYIKNSKLEDVRFKNTYMKGANLVHNNYLRNEFVNDCNLMDAVIVNIDGYFDISFINDKSYTKLSYGTYIGEYNFKHTAIKCEKDRDKFISISNSYMNLGNQFLLNRVMGKYEICFYQGRRALHFTLNKRRRIKSFIYDIVCGYGEKPGRAFALSLTVVLVFSIIYLFTGIVTPNGIINIYSIKREFTLSSLLELMIYSIYFSMVTFATVGYGDMLPNGVIGKAASVSEIILGILMVGVWTSTLVRKMTR